MSFTEQSFQQALRIELGARDVLVWRQPAGRVPAPGGGYIDCAPVGAADLCGVVEPEGWLLQLEVKGLTTCVTREQKAWAARMLRAGAVVLLVRAESEDLETAVRRGADKVEAAIEQRRARG